MITRTVETLLDDGTLTSPISWGETGIDVSGCIKVALVVTYNGTGDASEPFYFIVILGDGANVTRTYNGIFTLYDDDSDIVYFDTIGFQAMDVNVAYSSGALSDVTVTIEKLTA